MDRHHNEVAIGHQNQVLNALQLSAPALHRAMCKSSKVLSSSIPLDFIDIDADKVVFKYKENVSADALKRLLEFWANLLKSSTPNPIRTNTSQDMRRFEVFTTYDQLQTLVISAQQKEDEIRKAEIKNVETLYTRMKDQKYIVPEHKAEPTDTKSNKQIQEDSDAKLAALLQWQELHPDKKNVVKTFNKTELEQLKTDVTNEYSKYKL